MTTYTIEEQINYQNQLKQENLSKIDLIQTTKISYQEAIEALRPQEQFYQDNITQCNVQIADLIAGNEIIDATINSLEAIEINT